MEEHTLLVVGNICPEFGSGQVVDKMPESIKSCSTRILLGQLSIPIGNYPGHGFLVRAGLFQRPLGLACGSAHAPAGAADQSMPPAWVFVASACGAQSA